MGLEKAELKLVTAWAKTIGKSVLTTKPKRVNIDGLRYIPQQINNTEPPLRTVSEIIPDVMSLITQKPASQKNVYNIFETLLAKLGYKPKAIELKFSQFEDASFEFRPHVAQLFGNKKIKNFKEGDIVIILMHELTHAEDMLKLAQKIGIDKFKKLFSRLITPEERFNANFYEQHIRRVIPETGFDIKAILNDLKNLLSITPQRFTGHLAETLDKFKYSHSILESRARATERKIWAKMTPDAKRNCLNVFENKIPFKYIDKDFPKIMKLLEPLSDAEKDKKFNTLFNSILKKLNKQLRLHEKNENHEAAEKLRNILMDEEKAETIILKQIRKMLERESKQA